GGAPRGRQPELSERGVEGGQVPVALGVADDAVAVEDERRHARPALPKSSICSRAMAITAARWARNWDGGSYLPGFSALCAYPERMNAIFSAVEMLTLAQPREMRSRNCSGARPLPPCSAIGIGMAATISLTP